MNDVIETKALHQVLGAHASSIPVSSTKSMHGHALGAAGALELAATLQAIEHQIAPPTANFTDPDPECDLDYVPNEARAAKIDAAMSNSFAFGGLNAVLMVKAGGLTALPRTGRAMGATGCRWTQERKRTAHALKIRPSRTAGVQSSISPVLVLCAVCFLS